MYTMSEEGIQPTEEATKEQPEEQTEAAKPDDIINEVTEESNIPVGGGSSSSSSSSSCCCCFVTHLAQQSRPTGSSDKPSSAETWLLVPRKEGYGKLTGRLEGSKPKCRPEG